MKTLVKYFFLLASVSILLLSCNDDETDCSFTPSGTAVGSVSSYGFSGTSAMKINDSPVNHAVDCTMSFDSLSSNSVAAVIVLDRSAGESSPQVMFENLVIRITGPVALGGVAYEVTFSYEGDAVNRKVEDGVVTETPMSGVSLSGWMKNKNLGPKTRCSIGLTFDCELELKFTLGEDIYLVSIGPELYWP